jgi:hypothetical protein
MELDRIVDQLGLTVLTPDLLKRQPVVVSTAYASDVLSDILSHCRCGGLLVTIMRNLYVVAVAHQAGMDGIIFASGRRPDAPVIAKADELGLVLLTAPDPAFDVAGRLYALGLRAPRVR